MKNNNYSIKEDNKEINDEPNSVIKIILDQFAITYAIKRIFDKTSINITRYFNDAVILFVFLFFLFWQSKILGWELSIPTITLGLLALLIIIEFIGANNPIFKRLFFSDDKAKHFINNLNSYRVSYIQKNLPLLSFSPKCINYLLNKIEDENNNINPFIVEDILLHNTLSLENLNRIFSPNLLNSYINKELIQNILIKYKDELSPNNVENIYSAFKEDEELVKVLFATQKETYSLLLTHKHDSKLEEYYSLYQKNDKKRTKILKLVKRTKINVVFYRAIALFILWPGIAFLLLAIACYLLMVNSANLSEIILNSSIISFLIVTLLIIPLVNRCARFWRNNAKSKFYKEL